MVRISTDPGGRSAEASAQVLRLQNDFYARLAEETLNYLRGLQGVLVPAAPGTVLLPEPGAALGAAGRPGDAVGLTLEITNDQPVHCVVTPALSSLVSPSGVTWFPSARVHPAYLLVPPGRTETSHIELTLPAELPVGVYRGVLLLHGAPQGVAVTITVEAPKARKPAARRSTATSRGKTTR